MKANHLLYSGVIAAAAMMSAPAMGASYTHSLTDWAPPGSPTTPFNKQHTWNVDNTFTSVGTIEVWFYGDFDDPGENVNIEFENYHFGTFLDGDVTNDAFNAPAGGVLSGNAWDLAYPSQAVLSGNATDTGTQQIKIHYGKIKVSKAIIDDLVADGMVSFKLSFTGAVEDLTPPAPYEDWLQVRLTYVPTPAAATMGLASLCILAFRRRAQKS